MESKRCQPVTSTDPEALTRIIKMIQGGIQGRETAKTAHLEGWSGSGAYECDMLMYFASISTIDELNTVDGSANIRCWPLNDFNLECLGSKMPVVEGCRTDWMTLMDGPLFQSLVVRLFTNHAQIVSQHLGHAVDGVFELC